MTATADKEVIEDLCTSVRAVLSNHSATSLARALSDDDGYDVELWERMASLGWLGAMTEEQHGGAGLGMLAATTIVEELAYHNTCVPFISSAVLATTALGSGDNTVAETWLPELTAGRSLGAYCCTGRAGLADPHLLDVVAQPSSGGGLTLTGEANFAGDAAFADLVLVAARTTDGELLIVRVDPQTSGVGVAPVRTINRGHRLAHVRLSDAPAADVIAQGDQARSLFEHVAANAVVILAADAHGAARRALDLALEYAKQRHQFGRPIGSFQAVKHMLANMYTAVSASGACVRAAAEAIDRRDPLAPRLVATAGAYVRHSASEVVGSAMQIHGAIGYTWEHECHLLLKRAKFDERYLVNGWTGRDRLADIVLKGPNDSRH